MTDQISNRSEQLLKHAAHYSRLNWPMLSVAGITAGSSCTCGKTDCKAKGKHPRVADWPNKASTNIDAVTRVFAENDAINIGLVTGRRSQIVVLDVDARHFGIETLAECVREYGDLPLTPTVHTGGGGLHYYFLHPVEDCPSRISLLPGIDFKSDGGFVVAPPSRHSSGKEYVWDVENNLETTPLAPMPHWLLNLLYSHRNNITPSTDWPTFVTTQVSEGGRNNTLTKLTGHLMRRSVDPMVGVALIHAWNQTMCTPPLSFDEVCSIVRSIGDRELNQLKHEVDHGK